MLSSSRMQAISKDTLKDLLSHAFQHQYHVQDGQKENELKASAIVDKTMELLRCDYTVQLLDNSDGELGVNYPAQMALLQDARSPPVDVVRMRRLAVVARMGRCRGRFPIGVILYRGRHVCRSATLSVGAEMYPRHYYFSMFGGQSQQPGAATDAPDPATDTATDSVGTTTDSPDGESTRPDPDDGSPDTSSQLFDKIRSMDVRLLHLFNVRTISDLMVETKKVKFGLYVASSEKVDKLERYSGFQLVNMPYPGCEFFHRYCRSGYQAPGLMFDWTQKHINAEMSIPQPLADRLGCDWTQYRTWDTVELTANYLKLLLTCLHTGDAGDGLLVHCISGWDRTPLFISLLRLTLWADGLIHRSLDASQILFVTLAYDWFLFGHNLPDRITRDEEIMHFAFNFLKYIGSNEFSAAEFAGDAAEFACSEDLVAGGPVAGDLVAGGLVAGGQVAGGPVAEAAVSAPLSCARADGVLLTDSVLLERLETDSCSSAGSSDCAAAVSCQRQSIDSSCWPFVDEPAGSTAGDDLTDELLARSLLDESFCELGGSVRGSVLCSVSPLAVRRRSTSRRSMRLERQMSSSLESLPEQKSWSLSSMAASVGNMAVAEDAAGPPYSSVTTPRSCRSEVGSFSSGVYRAATSPQAVPDRTRHESSGSIGSWQIISDSGSVPGSMSNDSSVRSIGSSVSRSRQNSSCIAPDFLESTTTLISESDDESVSSTSRAGRLQAVRLLFLQAYSAAVGLRTDPQCQRTASSPSSGRFGLLPAVVSTLAGRVGIM